MPHGFDAYRAFISAPGDLERDRAHQLRLYLSAMAYLLVSGLRRSSHRERRFAGSLSE